METYATQAGRKPGRQESIFGQLLAYLGVGLLTIGTALVVWGYFGGEAVQAYQSTGWLVSTAGQMLLFLGVVTLVSGGMQQTTHEVAQRASNTSAARCTASSNRSRSCCRGHISRRNAAEPR